MKLDALVFGECYRVSPDFPMLSLMLELCCWLILRKLLIFILVLDVELSWTSTFHQEEKFILSKVCKWKSFLSHDSFEACFSNIGNEKKVGSLQFCQETSDKQYLWTVSVENNDLNDVSDLSDVRYRSGSSRACLKWQSSFGTESGDPQLGIIQARQCLLDENSVRTMPISKWAKIKCLKSAKICVSRICLETVPRVTRNGKLWAIVHLIRKFWSVPDEAFMMC